MNLSALAARRALVTPSKIHVSLPLLLMAVLYWFSSLPGTPLPDDIALYRLLNWLPPTVQNILHVPAYGALALAWRWALRAWLRTSGAGTLGACAISFTWGLLDEWHQAFVPGRFASLTDVALDATGIALGIWLAAWIGSRARNIQT
jgi:hypothetical protein